MFSRRATLTALAGSAIALAGCSTKPIGGGDPYFGEAVKFNAAVQTINPDPVYTADAAKPGDNGDKGASAVKRYRTDQVKDVEVMQTGEGSSGGSASR